MSLTELSTDEQKFFETGGAAAPAEPEVSPEPVPEPAILKDIPTFTDAPKPQQDDKTVPLAALHEARQIQKELREALKQRDEAIKATQQKAEKMEQTFQTFLQKQNEVPPPKYEEDPLGTLKWQNEQLEKRLNEMSQGVNQTAQQFQQQQAIQQFSQTVVSQEENFRKAATDYDAAVAHLKQVRISDFQDMGYDLQTATQLLQNEIMNFAQAAMQQGKNPAEVAYSMAKRYGYNAQEKTTEKQIAMLEKGEAASKSLAGGRAEAPLTLEALAQLDEDQLDQLVKDDKAWKKMLGGR